VQLNTTNGPRRLDENHRVRLVDDPAATSATFSRAVPSKLRAEAIAQVFRSCSLRAGALIDGIGWSRCNGKRKWQIGEIGW
jgi:hypothetical protein